MGKNRGMENLYGKMVEFIKEVTLTIRSMDLEYINGEMGINTKDNGMKEKCMVKDWYSTTTVNFEVVFLKMVFLSNGTVIYLKTNQLFDY